MSAVLVVVAAVVAAWCVCSQHCTAIACSGVSMSSSVSELSEQLKPLMLYWSCCATLLK
jgi:hypothetical protein